MNTLTVVGNMATDPDLRYTPSGSPVANFSLAQTPRKFNSQSGKWEDSGEPNFFRCNVWNQQAENVAESLKKGTRVIAIGKLRTEKYERNGETVTSTNNLDIEHIGPSLAFATVSVTRSAGAGGGEGGGGNYQKSTASARPANNAPAGEPPF
jgi:single-strand DNA-binding protein